MHQPLFFPLFLAMVTACGGLTVNGPADGGGGGGSSSSSGSDGTDDGGGGGASSGSFPVCPPDPPTVGAKCASPHQGCRYVQIGGGCAAYACDGTWRSAPEGC